MCLCPFTSVFHVSEIISFSVKLKLIIIQLLIRLLKSFGNNNIKTINPKILVKVSNSTAPWWQQLRQCSTYQATKCVKLVHEIECSISITWERLSVPSGQPIDFTVSQSVIKITINLICSLFGQNKDDSNGNIDYRKNIHYCVSRSDWLKRWILH